MYDGMVMLPVYWAALCLFVTLIGFIFAAAGIHARTYGAMAACAAPLFVAFMLGTGLQGVVALVTGVLGR